MSNGVLSTLTSSNGYTFATGLQPVAIGIDPSQHHFLFTANYLGPNVSGYGINTDGTLYGSQNSPYKANSLPTAIVAIPHK